MPALNGPSTERGKGNHLQPGMAEPKVSKITVMGTRTLCSFSCSQLLHIGTGREKHPVLWTPGSHLHEHCGS